MVKLKLKDNAAPEEKRISRNWRSIFTIRSKSEAEIVTINSETQSTRLMIPAINNDLCLIFTANIIKQDERKFWGKYNFMQKEAFVAESN